MTVDEERVNAERRFSWLPSVRIDQSHFPGTQVQLPWHVGDADDNLRKNYCRGNGEDNDQDDDADDENDDEDEDDDEDAG